MKAVMSALGMVKQMSLFDVSVYKMMLFSLGMGLATLVPRFARQSRWIWLAIVIISMLWLMPKIYRSRTDAPGFIAKQIANFHDLQFADLALFEITMVVFGILIYQVLPRFQTVALGRRGGIFLFGLGWILAMRVHQK